VVAHFHYTFFPIAVIGFFAGFTYWFPKMFGRMMNETLGKIHFWGTIIAVNFVFIPMFITGVAGDHRRIYSYEHFMQLATDGLGRLRILSTLGLVVMLLFQLVFLVNLIVSLWAGRRAERNPWRANTLEWVAPSPPPHGNFAEMPTVYRGPYEYGVPGRPDDHWPQNVPA
jgi:cytochrome c oxidase subunit 1